MDLIESPPRKSDSVRDKDELPNAAVLDEDEVTGDLVMDRRDKLRLLETSSFFCDEIKVHPFFYR